MRKSKYVSLLLAGAAATTLVACGQKEGGDWAESSTLYGDSAACTRDMDSSVSNEAYRAAKDEHATQAPKFATQANVKQQAARSATPPRSEPLTAVLAACSCR